MTIKRKSPPAMEEALIAPCGMNCAICAAYLAGKYDIRSKGIRQSYCIGCRARGKICAFIKRGCDLLQSGKATYCYECKDFPCERLQNLDLKYRTNFRTSFIENLRSIKKNGAAKFLKAQRRKWKCPKCGDVICCHNGICYACGTKALKKKRHQYRWE